MQEANLFLIFIKKFNNLEINYFVTGSIASIIYGEPRVTHDIDLIIELKKDEDIQSVIKAFPQKDFYCPPFEIIKIEKNRNQRGHFNIIHHESGFKADIYLLGNDKLNLWALKNSKGINFLNHSIKIAPPEYVIIRKLEYYKEGGSQKHLLDIQSMLENSNQKIDQDILKNFIDQLSLKKEWEKFEKR